ncbi:MAG: di-trans,poly-cis-decaprenylcistransferase, partial [Clostridia bacterium]|nr:di-trans,poly-cis-decaprenylcistransferase [Clostridia bacterium]
MLFKNKKEFKVDSQLSHIAFIMDGNGRWAKKRGLPRKLGHKYGAEAFENTVRNCHKIGIKTVTVYAFSTENWSRPKEEIDAIIDLMKKYIEEAYKYDDVRIIFIGDKSPLPEDLKNSMMDLENSTKNNENTLNIAFNYGGRAEIVNACNEIIKERKSTITEEDINNHLYTKESPDPDLIIRTANEYRLSNFLLWQCAYS